MALEARKVPQIVAAIHELRAAEQRRSANISPRMQGGLDQHTLQMVQGMIRESELRSRKETLDLERRLKEESVTVNGSVFASLQATISWCGCVPGNAWATFIDLTSLLQFVTSEV